MTRYPRAWRCITLFLLSVVATHRVRAQQPGPGVVAPDFSLVALDSTAVRLSAFRGRPVVINFWATWCPPCIHEMPELAARFTTYAGDSLVVLAVNADAEKERKIRQFTTDMHLPFPVLLDPRLKAATAYGVIQLPVTVFVDSAGVIRSVHTGPIRPSELDAGVRGIVGR